METNELNNLKQLLHNKSTVLVGLEIAKNLDDVTFLELIFDLPYSKEEYAHYYIYTFKYLSKILRISVYPDITRNNKISIHFNYFNYYWKHDHPQNNKDLRKFIIKHINSIVHLNQF